VVLYKHNWMPNCR